MNVAFDRPERRETIVGPFPVECAAEARVHPATSRDRRSLGPSWPATAFGVAFVVGLTMVLYGAPVPRLSEELYLPLVRHSGNAAYLAGDWTLRGPFSEHWVFDHAFGWLAAALPLPLFAWIGRIVVWTLLAWMLIRLGRRLGASTGAAAAGIGLWLIANQSFVGGDWMFGTFEAKTVGYCLLVAAILAAANRRVGWAMVLLGATVSFHPGVGIWAGLGLGVTLLGLPETRASALRWGPVGALLAVPGIVGALSVGGFRAASLTRFLVIEAVPQHADPLFGGARLPGLQIVVHIAALAAMFAANWWWKRTASPDSSFTQRVLWGVQLVTMGAVAFAFVARALHWWSFLMLSPLRVGPLVVALVFFLNLTRRVQELHREHPSRSSWRSPAIRLAAVGILAAVFVTSPLLAVPRMALRTIEAWTSPSDETVAFDWIRAHTPKTTRCVVPVDRQDAFMIAERPIVANWQAIRYDDLAGWHRRVVQLVGGARYFTDTHAPGRVAGRRGGDLEALRHAYNALSRRDLVAIAHRYHATCIVATTAYRLPVWHRSGTARVYRLEPRPEIPAPETAVSGG
jgi:hypothetical protein